LDVTGTAKISTGVITPVIYPAANGTTAVQITKADGTTAVVNVDTTNAYVGVGTTAPVDPLSLGAVNASATHASLNLSNTALVG
ncbi:hypothetical protein NL533_33680, partial [Klebsiella pneumoniae]|nr:hypothetical protein [Klebsiella pneumoniae]